MRIGTTTYLAEVQAGFRLRGEGEFGTFDAGAALVALRAGVKADAAEGPEQDLDDLAAEATRHGPVAELVRQHRPGKDGLFSWWLLIRKHHRWVNLNMLFFPTEFQHRNCKFWGPR